MRVSAPIAAPLIALSFGLLGACGASGGVPRCCDSAGVPGGGGGTAAAGASGSPGAAGGAGAAGEGASAGASGAGAGGGGAGGGGGTAGAGTAGGDGKPSGMSAGCGKTVAEVPGKWTTHDTLVTVDAQFAAQSKRRYFTNPPPSYDPNKPWPTFWGNGCGTGSSAEGELLMSGPASTQSVQVQLLAYSGCFSAGPDGDNADSPELPYFDQVLSEVEAEYCVDEGKVFVSGYSSGGWFTALMSCNRAAVIRGVGWAAAGLQLNHNPCTGQTAAIVVRGAGDTGTPEAQTLAAIDSLRMRNGCSAATMPWDPGETAFDTTPCLEYQGCQAGFPVVYCSVPGGHTDGGPLTSQGFWKFWTSL